MALLMILQTFRHLPVAMMYTGKAEVSDYRKQNPNIVDFFCWIVSVYLERAQQFV